MFKYRERYRSGVPHLYPGAPTINKHPVLMKNVLVALVVATCVFLVILGAAFRQEAPSSGTVEMDKTAAGNLGMALTDAVLTLKESKIQGSVFEDRARIDLFSDADQNYQVAVFPTDRLGNVEDDLFFQLLPSANTNSTTRWAVIEGWKGAGLHIGTGGFAKPVVFAINRVEKMRLDAAGNLGIGTPTPANELSVNGKVDADEFIVNPEIPPDFVFEDDYTLRSLEQVKQYIDEHGHLPEIPSAAEMQAEGVAMGAMQMKLLQKIEELTLYLIEQQQQIADLKKTNEELRELRASSTRTP